jgi:hypothetical protein
MKTWTTVILMVIFAAINIPYFPNPVNLVAFGFALGMVTSVIINHTIK